MHRHRSAPPGGSAAQTNHDEDDRLAVSVAEAARRLDVSPMTLYREIAAGRLAAIRIRDRLLIPRIVLDRLIEDAIGGLLSWHRGVARMQPDPWPPLPLGGHRALDAPPFTSSGDQLLAVGLGAAAGADALVWATGQAAGLVFGHTWLELFPADVAHVLWHLPQHWNDPAQAWPPAVREPLPGPAGMYASLAGLVGGLSGGTAAVLRHLPRRPAGHRPSHARPAKHAAAWAGSRELRLLTVHEPEPAG